MCYACFKKALPVTGVSKEGMLSTVRCAGQSTCQFRIKGRAKHWKDLSLEVKDEFPWNWHQLPGIPFTSFGCHASCCPALTDLISVTPTLVTSSLGNYYAFSILKKVWKPVVYLGGQGANNPGRQVEGPANFPFLPSVAPSIVNLLGDHPPLPPPFF